MTDEALEAALKKRFPNGWLGWLEQVEGEQVRVAGALDGNEQVEAYGDTPRKAREALLKLAKSKA